MDSEHNLNLTTTQHWIIMLYLMTKQIVITHPSFSPLSCCPSGFRDYKLLLLFLPMAIWIIHLLHHALFDAGFVALLGREYVFALSLHIKKTMLKCL